MSDYDLQRVETLFQAAADLAIADRSSYLDGACSDDAGLREHVETLLGRLDKTRSVATPNDGDAEAAPSGLGLAEGPGAIIDRYKLLQVIGEGGFGSVYMAEQQRPVVRKVALKIIKLGMDTKEVVARFEAERQALALMDHPNIAKVLDGGATASGRPYFVMELVRGVSITEYCDKNSLTTQHRLELFVQVCHALQHAHQKGVIHRDLKPSNVLVTLHDGTPVPKVIDFGVAKAMHTRLTEKTLFTRYEQFIGTPAYMSPEQAEMSALDVDTRTDIYALGVLLYELLTGSTPFDTESLMRAGVAEIQRIIREEQPPRPSLRISTAGTALLAGHRHLDVQALSRRLRGDLDWIVMKAMEKDRSRRYATAGELADDVRRHLANEPVNAGPPSTVYRMRKAFARHRPVLIAGMFVAAALILAVIGTTIGMIEAGRNARLARTQAANALSALDFLDSTLALTNPQIVLSPDVTVRTLLDETASRVPTAFKDQPWMEARVRSTIGRAYTSLSELELAEPHLRRVVEVIDAETDGQGPSVEDGKRTGYDAGQYYEALWALTNVAFNLERPDAFAISRRARVIGLGHVGRSHPVLASELQAFSDAVERGAWSLEDGAMAGIVEQFEAVRGRADETLASGDRLWPIVADTFLAAGYTVWYTPHESLAERVWKEALHIQQRELPADHPNTAHTVSLLVGILTNADRLDDAEALSRESIDAMKRVHGERDLRVGMSQSSLGEILVRQERYAEAESVLLGGHRIILEALKDESNWIAVESIDRVIQLYDAWERPEAAHPYRESLARTAATGKFIIQLPVVQRAFGPHYESLTSSMARVREGAGAVSFIAVPGTRRMEGLDEELAAMFAARRELLAPDEPLAAAYARLLLGWAAAFDHGHHAEGRRLLATEALSILEAWPELFLEQAEAHAVLAEVTAGDEAREHARAAWRLVQEGDLAERWFVASILVRIARSLEAGGLRNEAVSLLLRAYEVLDSQLGAHYADTKEAAWMLHELYMKMGRPEEAERFAAPAPV